MNPTETIAGRQTGIKAMAFFWLAAVFLTIFSSKLWLIDRFGSSLPVWDQWAAEGWGLYIPFFENKLVLKDLFTAHCEHRIFVNRVLSLLLLVLNGQWDARLGMVFNALVTAGTGVALSAFAWKLLGKKHLAVLCLFNTLVFSLPFSLECSLLGFIANYLLIAFALLAVWFLLRCKLFSGQWFLGLLCALLSLVTMGSGFCAAASVLAIILLRAVMRQDRPWRNLISTVVLGAIVMAGFFLIVDVPGHAAFKPPNIGVFFVSFAQTLAWPNFDFPWTALIIWFPSLLLLSEYILRRTDERNSAEFVIGFGLWIALQDAALSFSRWSAITSRHTVFLCLSLPINFLALLLLLHERSAIHLLRKFLVVLLIVWLGNAGYNLSKMSGKTQLAEAVKFKPHLVQCEQNVRSFLQSDNIADLENKPLYDIPFPDPKGLALILRNPHIRAILPSCVAGSNKPGPLSVFVSKLAPKGDKLLIIGICLLAVLTGIRFYQSLGTLEKRLLIIRWTDFRRLLKPAGIVLIIAVLVLIAGKMYFLWSPYGLKVTYFRGANFEQKICSRTEKAVCRDYGDKSPAWRVPRKNFSALWQGILKVPETDEYYFFSQSDDGLRLIIDGEKIIDNWCDQSWNASSTGVRVHLTAGDHRIAVEHYNNDGESALRIKWCGGPVPANTVLAAPYLRKHK